MKAITIRELHANTGRWVRQAAELGEIRVTDRGRTVAKLLPERHTAATPFFSRRTWLPRYQRLARSGRLGRGTDSTRAISEEREERTV